MQLQVIGLQKGCCEIHKYAPVNKFATNVNVVKDTVNGVEKNVLALTAWNGDNPDHCPGTSCYKVLYDLNQYHTLQVASHCVPLCVARGC